MKNNQQSGSSMVEMLGIIGIIAMVSIGAIKVYSGIMDKFRISVTNTQIQTIAKNVHELYVAKSNYLNLTTAVVISENLAPKEMITSGSTAFLLNKMGGKTTVTAATDGTKKSESFYLWFSGLSRAACVEIAKLNPDPSGKLNFVEVRVGPANATQTGFSSAPGIYDASDVAAGTVSIANLNAFCSHASNNGIRWEFY